MKSIFIKSAIAYKIATEENAKQLAQTVLGGEACGGVDQIEQAGLSQSTSSFGNEFCNPEFENGCDFIENFGFDCGFGFNLAIVENQTISD